MAIRHIFLSVVGAAAFFVAAPASAQLVQAPNYRNSANSPEGAKGVIILNADGSVATTAKRSTSTIANGSVAVTNAYQSALAASTTRSGCLIQNTSAGTIKLFLGAPGSATDAQAFQIPAGWAFSCRSGELVITDQISITGTAGATYVVSTQ